ncbi:MAG: hypothetical protein AMXMBFR33_47410 [Candidatus Xenobia bacterium]|jgi:hypothetical protein
MRVLVWCLAVLSLMLPARGQVVGLVLDPVESQYCVARSNARPLKLYDLVSIRRGGMELSQARVVQAGSVCMLRLLSACSVQRGDQVVFLSAGPPPPQATSNAQRRALQASFGPGPAIPPHHLVVQIPCSRPPAGKASFSGSGGSSASGGG